MTEKVADNNNKYSELFNYCKIASWLENTTIPQKVKLCVKKIIPERLSSQLNVLNEIDVIKIINNIEENKKAYHSICLKLLSIIFLKDSINIEYIDNNLFIPDLLKDISITYNEGSLQDDVKPGCSFTARNKNITMVFCFNDADSKVVKQTAELVFKNDNNSFKMICILITKSDEELKEYRKYENADYWKRAFFISFDELIQTAEKMNPDDFTTIYAPSVKNDYSGSRAPGIKMFIAHVIGNKKIGGEDSNHYLLHFKSPGIQRIIPGQFVMLNTKPYSEQSIINLPRVIESTTKHSFPPKPISYLKRPFGIHRAVYKHFDNGYLSTLHLPEFLSTILHNVYPHEFTIFYKVLKNGTGTNELKKVRKGDKIQVIGSLGKRFNLRNLRIKEFEEVHVIGGGVGMAPLVFLVQALRFFSFKVKAFFGVESIELLKHQKDQVKQNSNDQGFAEESKDAYIYYNDLLDAGLSENDIYVSFDKESKNSVIKNYRTGFISDYYREYIHNHYNQETKTIAFTCGPMPMMHAIYAITSKSGIQLKVLMEKRMACGIGVCLSCVCRTKSKDKGETYSRVCVDGPLFDAEDIVWEKIHMT